MFGTTPQTQAQLGSTLFGSSFAKPSQPISTPFNFGSATTANVSSANTTTPQFGSGFGSVVTSTPVATSTTTPAASSLFGNVATTASGAPTAGIGQPLGGLGGIVPQGQSSVGAPAAPGATRPKDTILPPEIQSLVTEFEAELKKNYATSEELSSMRQYSQMLRVTGQIKEVTDSLDSIGLSLEKLRSETNKLNECMKEELRCGNSAKSIQGSPGYHGEYDFAALRLLDVTSEHEKLFSTLQQEVFELERQMVRRREARSDDHLITAQELSVHLQKMKATFYSVAADLYTVHESVVNLKELYQRYRRSVGDPISPFPLRHSNKSSIFSSPGAMPKNLFGPSPFHIHDPTFNKLQGSTDEATSKPSTTGASPGFSDAFGSSAFSKPPGNLFSSPSTGTATLFSNPVSTNSSSGTLFGGTATVSKPVAACAPLASITTSPSGTKRNAP